MPPATLPTSGPAPQCVLLVGGGAVPSSLVAALGQRGIGATIARAAPEVMAALAQGEVSSVVVVEPDRQDRAGELRDAAVTYHPAVRFWSYTPQAPGREARLAVFPSTPEETGKEAPNSGRETNRCYSSPYRGADHATATPAGPSDSKTAPPLGAIPPLTAPPYPGGLDDDPLLVTELELAMLLETDTTTPPGPTPGR